MLKEQELIEIYQLVTTEGWRTIDVAEKFDVSPRTIQRFLQRNGTDYKKFWGKVDTGEINLTSNIDDKIEEGIDRGDEEFVKQAKRLRNAQKTNTQLRRLQRNSFDNEELYEQFLEGVEMAVKNLNVSETTTLKYRPHTNAKGATLEILFSDLQIGKVSRYYNTEIAKRAVREYCQGILQAIMDREALYNVERIVFAMVGDIVEDHMKHGVQSAISTDTGLAEQMHDAITCIWEDLLHPLASLNIPMDVLCVTGNHGSSMHKGMDSFKAGRYSYDFVIHQALASLARVTKLDHVTFNIPDGTFGTMEIYGKHAVYEHGYHNNQSEKGMTDQMMKRGQQLKRHVSYWRQGDKHHHACFGQGEQVLNGAFFGIEQEGLEYSGILGFCSVPSQTVMFHVDEKVGGRSNIKEVLNIQVGQTDITVD